MQTSRTGLRCVPRRDRDALHPSLSSLVANHLLKFGKAPFVNAFRLAGLTNPVEVFQDDPLIVRLGLSHDLFADAVIGVRDKTPCMFEFMQATLQSDACISQGRLEQGWWQPVLTLRHNRACRRDSGRHPTTC